MTATGATCHAPSVVFVQTTRPDHREQVLARLRDALGARRGRRQAIAAGRAEVYLVEAVVDRPLIAVAEARKQFPPTWRLEGMPIS